MGEWKGTNKGTPSLPGGNECTLGWAQTETKENSGLCSPPGLSGNLLGQDLLGQMDAIITPDLLAFYDDKIEQGVIRQTPTPGFTPQR